MDLEKEIKQIATQTAQEEISKIPPVVFPTSIEVSNFPEPKAPIVNVAPPVVNVPPANITVNPPEVVVNVPETKPTVINLTKLEEGISELANLLTELKDKKNEVKVVGGGSWAPIVEQMQSEQNTVSVSNTSTTALNNGQTYTGTWEDVSKYDSVIVAVTTDKAGTYYIDFSPDASNVDSTLTRYHKVGEIHVPHRFTVTRKYFRVRFTNDSGSNQTYFRLQTLLGEKQQLNAPLDGTLAQDFGAIVVRPTLPIDEVARGLREGVVNFNKFGYNTDLDAASGEQVVWGDTANDTLTVLETASTFTIAYDGTGGGTTDGTGTTGATELTITYIDANGAHATSVHTLGTDGSDTTSFTGFGINRVRVTAAGSNNTNVSDIRITATTGGSVQAFIPAGTGVTQQAIYFVGANSRAILRYVLINCGKIGGASPVVTFKAYQFDRITSTRYEILRYIVDTSVENSVDITDPHGVLSTISESSCIYFVADTNTDNTIASVRFGITEYKDVDA